MPVFASDKKACQGTIHALLLLTHPFEVVQVREALAKHVDPEHLYDSLGGSKGETVDRESLRKMMLEVDKRRAAHLAKAYPKDSPEA